MSTTLLELLTDWTSRSSPPGPPPELASAARGAPHAPAGASRRAARRAARPPAGGHLPVLAEELRGAARPAARADRRSTAPSATAATRAWSPSASGPSGTLIAIDRDPLAEERFAALAAETACSVRFIRSGYAEALATLGRGGR